MKRRVSLLLFLVLGIGFVALPLGCHKAPKASVEYYCPMHPTYVTTQPGDCPICNMQLDSRPVTHAVPAPTAAPAPDSAGRVLYWRNPMDPRITSPVPAKDAMGMDFVPVYASSESGVPAQGVPGYAPVQLDSTAIRLAGVQTAVATRERLTRTVRTVGVVAPDETRLHHVHVKVAGFVEELFLNATGQRVYAGDPAFSFYSPELLASQEEFLRARQAVAGLEAGATPETRRAAEDLLGAARRRLELFDVPQSFIAQLERTGKAQRTVTMQAHASGWVTMKDVVEGQRVEPGAELFTITDLATLWIEADFYENEAHLVHVGQQATLTLPYDAATRFTGRVAYVYPYFDPQTRTLRVRFEVANPNLVLKPAMYVDVTLDVEAADGVVVPESAVLDSGVRRIVFVEGAGGRYEPRAVQVGLRSSGRVQVTSGVREGERVVVRANFLLDSESRLRGAVGATATPSEARP